MVEPGIATARTADLFKPIDTTHASYIASINKGSGLFPIIGETQAVPLSTPKVTNKQTTLVKDFAQGIEISKNLFDDKHYVSHIVVTVSPFFHRKMVLA